jgi:uncharacterized protein (UPF0332 family)
MSKANLRALVRFRIEQAEEALRVGELLRTANAPREIVNRAYYAMFYAVLALLGSQKRETSRHRAAITLFDKDYVKAGIFTKDFSRWLHEAFNLRLASDYGPFFQPSQQDAEDILGRAQTFVSAVKTHLTLFLSASDNAEGATSNS